MNDDSSFTICFMPSVMPFQYAAVTCSCSTQDIDACGCFCFDSFIFFLKKKFFAQHKPFRTPNAQFYELWKATAVCHAIKCFQMHRTFTAILNCVVLRFREKMFTRSMKVRRRVIFKSALLLPVPPKMCCPWHSKAVDFRLDYFEWFRWFIWLEHIRRTRGKCRKALKQTVNCARDAF